MTKKVHIKTNHPQKYCKKRTFDRFLIHKECLNICQKLHDNGFDAWLVGGCVRDLLLGLKPKDFDITTVATPTQIKQLFKCRCYIIGKRFQIAHIFVRGSKEPIEVSTLRATQGVEKKHTKHPLHTRVINADGRIEKDNIFGQSLQEDSHRRDFTINAIYYHPNTDQCIDYTNGIEDIRKGLLRSIGNPEKRYFEDPLRMIRALRFLAKTNLTLDPKEVSAISKCKHQLQAIPAARMMDESRKLFLKGHAWSSFEKLRDHRLLSTLLPSVDEALGQPTFSLKYLQFIKSALQNTDQRIRENKPVSIPFLFASLLWVVVQNRQHETNRASNNVTLKLSLCEEICWQQRHTTRLSKYWIQQIIDIWMTHQRLIKHNLDKGSQKQTQSLLKLDKFRAAYDFLCLRVDSGEAPEYENIARWWTTFEDTT